MRALRFRCTALTTQAALVAVSSTRMWCSTESNPKDKAEGNETAKETEEPKVTKEDIEKFHAELEESKKVLAEMKEQLSYRTGDVENARRIGREDVEKAKLFGITSFGKDMLEVADTLEKGIEAFSKLPAEQLTEDKALDSIFRGIKQAYKVLHNNMSSHGIEKMGVTVGTPFDFNFHDALARMPPNDKAPANTICHVLKDGYTIKSRVLRAAQVAVASDDF